MMIKNQTITMSESDLPFGVLRHFQQINHPKSKTPGKEFTDFNISYDEDGNKEFTFIDSTHNRVLLGVCDDIEIEREDYKDIPASYRTSLIFNSGFDLYEYQQKMHDVTIKEFLDNPYGYGRILNDSNPGEGKGAMTNATIATLNLRPLILIKPSYVKKWIEELQAHFHVKRDKILLINSAKQLRELKSNDKCKIVIITTTLITSAMKREDTVEVLRNLTKIVKCELMVNDETHQHFDAVANAVRLINPRFLIGMSASLTSNYAAEEKRQLNLFPNDIRLSFKAPMPYIHYLINSYFIRNVTEYHYKGAMGYSHNKLEENLLAADETFKEYMDIVITSLKFKFVMNKQYKKGDRAIVFFSSISMIDKVTNYLKAKLEKSNSPLRVISYTGDNDYEDMYEADIIIATQGKAGTAIDIPKLLYVLNTINIGSWQLNMQMPGRLRRRPKKKLIFEQLNCVNISKHNSYTRSYLNKYGYKYKTITNETTNLKPLTMRTYGKRSNHKGKKKYRRY